MNRLIKQLNRYNGNICFAAETDSQFFIFECDRYNAAVSNAISSRKITGICIKDIDEYLVAFSNNFIGLYQNGVLNETYINSTIPTIDRLVNRQDGVYYGLDRSSATIYRFTINPFTIDWHYNVLNVTSEYQRKGEIIVRESDDTLIYYDMQKIFVIADIGSSATIVNYIPIGDSNSLFVNINGQHSAEYTSLRWRQVSGDELEQSSSSSSSSSSSEGYSSSSSSSSSSSFGYSSSSSSSSSSIGFSSSSSSSEKYSSSSSSSSSLGYSSSSSSAAYLELIPLTSNSGYKLVCCSDDGTKVAAFRDDSVGGDYSLYLSSDSGDTWVKNTALDSAAGTGSWWVGLSISPSGNNLIVGDNSTNGRIFVSPNFGVNWYMRSMSGYSSSGAYWSAVSVTDTYSPSSTGVWWLAGNGAFDPAMVEGFLDTTSTPSFTYVGEVIVGAGLHYWKAAKVFEDGAFDRAIIVENGIVWSNYDDPFGSTWADITPSSRLSGGGGVFFYINGKYNSYSNTKYILNEENGLTSRFFISSDRGNNWTVIKDIPNAGQGERSCDISLDGQDIMITNGKTVSVSEDAGLTWLDIDSAIDFWNGFYYTYNAFDRCAMSSDGNKKYITSREKPIYKIVKRE